MRRPPKPRIAKPRLKWAWNKSKSVWEPYHRVRWTENGKRKERSILLRWQGDAQRLDDLYWECEAGRHDAQKPSRVQHSWREAIESWRSDPRVQGALAASTKASYRRDMDAILEKNGHLAMALTSRQAVRDGHAAMSDTTRKADKRLAVISLLWTYAQKKLDWPLGENPASGIDRYGKQKEYEPWPDWMIRNLDTAPDAVHRAATLIMNTGQRPNAAIRMPYDRFDGEWMTVEDEKGQERFEVFCPESLQRKLNEWPRVGAFIIAKNLRQPLGYNAVEKQFRAWRKTLGDEARKYVLHGLRKVAIINLAESGWSDAEIQAVTNQSAEMVAYYRKRASRKALSKAAHLRTERKRNK